jgi:hypothetical protein
LRHRIPLSFTALSLSCALAGTASAANDGLAAPGAAPSGERPGPAPPPTDSGESDEKRAEPDYDGRGDRTTAGDVLIWVPRVLLAPPYLVSEYLLRRPIGFLITGAERTGIPVLVYDFFAFGPDHKAGVFPTVFYSFGFRTSVGLYAFWNDALLPGHELRLRGSYGGKDWLAGAFTERFRFGDDPDNLAALDASAVHRPDYAFFGIGPDSRSEDEVRYGRDTLEARLRVDKGLWRESSFRAEVLLRDVDFFRGGLREEEVLDDAIADGSMPIPDGYERGYTIARSGVVLSLDDRLPRPAPGSGFRLRGGVAHSAELRERGSFLTYGGSATGFVDLNDVHRVVSLTAMTRMVDPVGDSTVPFTELVTLGGSEPMRGFFPGRLTGQSAAVLDLAYKWPIWIWLDGAMHAEFGNVFGEHLAGFELAKFRWSGSIGIESSDVTDNPLQIMLGLGSETFESGGSVDSFRFVLGTTNGF